MQELFFLIQAKEREELRSYIVRFGSAPVLANFRRLAAKISRLNGELKKLKSFNPRQEKENAIHFPYLLEHKTKTDNQVKTS